MLGQMICQLLFLNSGRELSRKFYLPPALLQEWHRIGKITLMPQLGLLDGYSIPELLSVDGVEAGIRLALI